MSKSPKHTVSEIRAAIRTNPHLTRFTDKFDTDGDTECWLWNAGVDKSNGYGAFKLFDRKFNSHRLAWLLHRDEDFTGLLVCHQCDVKLCVNPDHLFLGSYKDNMQDASRKGRLSNRKRRKMTDKEHDLFELFARHGAGNHMLSRAFLLPYSTARRQRMKVIESMEHQAEPVPDSPLSH